MGDDRPKMLKNVQGTGGAKQARSLLRIWSWNVTAIGGTGFLNMLAFIGEREGVDIFVFQETRWPFTTDFTLKEGWRSIGTGEKGSYSGVAFFLSPTTHPSVISYLLLTDRVAALLLRTVSGPLLLGNLHAEHEEQELEKIVLIKVPEDIYPDIRSIIVFLFDKSGFKKVNIDEKIDFSKLYETRKAQK